MSKWVIAHWKEGTMDTAFVPSKALILKAKERGCTGLSFTFNEPALWFEYTLDSASLSKSEGLYTNYVTNGFITEKALETIDPFLMSIAWI